MRLTIRTKPYTERGIRRVPCLRCGESSRFQWNICSLAGKHGVCAECDIELNRTVLAFMRLPNAGWLADEYEAQVRAAQAGVTRMGGDGEAGSGAEGPSTRSEGCAP